MNAKERAVQEHAELRERLAKLVNFITDPENSDFYQSGLLREQVQAMTDYAVILSKRIAGWQD